MTRFLLLALTVALLCTPQVTLAQAPAAGRYQFSVDLTQINNDELAITLIPPKLKGKTAVYRMPKVIPGTYSISSFGRFVNGLQAMDSKGNTLPVKRMDENNWEIGDADKLAKLTYTVDDTWDTEIKEDFIFEPAGVSFERDSAFVWNASGLFGYFNDLTRAEYRVTVTKPKGFYGSTSLVPVRSTETTDEWSIPNYMDLVDAPMLYCRPDTATIEVGGALVLFSTYTPTGKKWSKDLLKEIAPVLLAAKDYLGGTLPVKKYAVITYLSPTGFKSGNAGALEHSYSTLLAMPEGPLEQIAEGIRSVTSHEFFHIVTPLNVHSEQIGDFDYTNPKMSEHLWLYEGVTEYNANISQVRSGVITEEAFLNEMIGKVRANEAFYGGDTVSFTKMSRRVLEPAYQRVYGNVYQKGAVIGMVLDLHLRNWSKGKYGVNTLLADLSKKYGPSKSFKDEELLDEIARLTYPELREFFRKHVEGFEPLPLREALGWAGIDYQATVSDMQYSTGLIRGTAAPNPQTGQFTAVNLGQLSNDITRDLGLQEGDALLKFNGQAVTLENYVALRSSFLSQVKDGDAIEWVVGRKNSAGETQEVTLKTTARKVAIVQKHVARYRPDATPEQMALRKAWLKN